MEVEENPGDIILNVSFTGEVKRHEQELRELWGGPLCVTQGGKTLKELEEIQRTFDPAESVSRACGRTSMSKQTWWR